MGELSHFQRGQIVRSHLAAASVSKMATLLGVSRTAVYKVMMAHTNHRKTSSGHTQIIGRHHQLRGAAAERQS